MDRGQADILVGDLAKAMGIEALALDAGGMCVLALEEDGETLLLSIGHNPNAGSVDLMCCLDVIEPSPACVAEALRANQDGGPDAVTLAAEPSTGALVVQQRLLGPDLGEGGLPGAVTRFVDEATAWRKRFMELSASPTSAPATPAGQGFNPGMRA